MKWVKIIIYNNHNRKEIKNKIFKVYLLLCKLLYVTDVLHLVPQEKGCGSSSMVVLWKRCCSGSSTELWCGIILILCGSSPGTIYTMVPWA